MILHALCDYYRRKSADPESGMAPKGFEQKPIPFIVKIDDKGKFIQLVDTRLPEGKKLVPRNYLVPQTKKRSGAKSYAIANLLWDHYGYLFAQPKLTKPNTTPTEKDVDMAHNQHQSFIQQVEQLADAIPDCPDIQAVLGFVHDFEQAKGVKADPIYPGCLKINGCNFAFQRVTQDHLCCQSPKLQSYLSNEGKSGNNGEGICLVTGEKSSIARLHDGIGQIVGKPAPLASINAPAFESYGKNQGQNFPVGEQSVFEYATALNHLLRRDSKQKLFINGTTLICWSQKAHSLETDLPMLFGQSSDDPDAGTEKVIQHYQSLMNGAWQAPDDKQLFFILGLAPNAPARIVVRFWLTGTVADFSQRVAQWFSDIDIVGRDKFGTPSLYRVLISTAFLHKADNLPPNLAGDLCLSIMQGLPLPATLFHGVLRRVKSEKGYISYERACVIKAYINRKLRYAHHITDKELSVSLNLQETRIGYRLGRLFAAYEKLQQDAQGRELNSTIRDRYYSSASCTPNTVFPTLDRLSIHHLKKLKIAARVAIEKRIQEIMDEIQEFPPHMGLDDQGLFAIGYYHQKQFFFTKQDDKNNTQDEQGVSL